MKKKCSNVDGKSNCSNPKAIKNCSNIDRRKKYKNLMGSGKCTCTNYTQIENWRRNGCQEKQKQIKEIRQCCVSKCKKKFTDGAHIVDETGKIYIMPMCKVHNLKKDNQPWFKSKLDWALVKECCCYKLVQWRRQQYLRIRSCNCNSKYKYNCKCSANNNFACSCPSPSP